MTANLPGTTCDEPSPATPNRRCQHTVIDGLHHGDHEHYDPATNTISHWPNQAPGAHRNRTPNRHDASTGQTTITMQRCCNGCGRSLGDATPIEIACATLGIDLPDVTGECAVCSDR